MSDPANPYSSSAALDAEPPGSPRTSFVLDFEVRDEDWVAMMVYCSWESPVARSRVQKANRRRLLIRLAAVVAIVTLSLESWFRTSTTVLALAGALVLYFVLEILLMLGFARSGGRRWVASYAFDLLAAGRNRTLVGPIRLEVSPDGVDVQASFHRSMMTWPALERIVRMPRHILLMWSAASGQIIPQRVFLTPQEREDFIATCQAYAPEAEIEQCA